MLTIHRRSESVNYSIIIFSLVKTDFTLKWFEKSLRIYLACVSYSDTSSRSHIWPVTDKNKRVKQHKQNKLTNYQASFRSVDLVKLTI